MKNRKPEKGKSRKPSKIMQGVMEAAAWTRGEDVGVRTHQVEIPDVDVKAVRAKLDLSQEAFAMRFGFPVNSLRNWEQKRYQPDIPTRILLKIIEKHSDVVEGVLKDLRPRPAA